MISVAIQHHPARAEILPRLISRLTPLSVQVIRDPQPEARRDPWRTYRHVLETTPEWATHRVVIQDDAAPCRRFPELLRAAIAARPDRMLCLCVCGRPSHTAHAVLRAGSKGDAWIVLHRNQWVPCIGLVWPTRLIGAALAWIDGQHWPRDFIADDEIIGRVARGLREHVLATVPSLVQHEDIVPSLAGKQARAGKDAGRVAALFEEDPREIDWTRGPT